MARKTRSAPAPNPIDFAREMFRTELNDACLADYLVLRVPAAHTIEEPLVWWIERTNAGAGDDSEQRWIYKDRTWQAENQS